MMLRVRKKKRRSKGKRKYQASMMLKVSGGNELGSFPLGS